MPSTSGQNFVSVIPAAVADSEKSSSKVPPPRLLLHRLPPRQRRRLACPQPSLVQIPEGHKHIQHRSAVLLRRLDPRLTRDGRERDVSLDLPPQGPLLRFLDVRARRRYRTIRDAAERELHGDPAPYPGRRGAPAAREGRDDDDGPAQRGL